MAGQVEIKNMALFCDFENIALGVRDAKYAKFDIQKVLERLLLKGSIVVKKGREAEVERIFEKWDLHAVRIGEVTADSMLRIRDHGVVVAEVPNRALTDEGPVYQRPFHPPADLAERQRMPVVAMRVDVDT